MNFAKYRVQLSTGKKYSSKYEYKYEYEYSIPGAVTCSKTFLSQGFALLTPIGVVTAGPHLQWVVYKMTQYDLVHDVDQSSYRNEKTESQDFSRTIPGLFSFFKDSISS